MKIFIDSADIEEIKKVKEYGLLDGVTTNPSLIKKSVDKLKKNGKEISLEKYIKEILKVAKGKPVSIEVVGKNFKEMVSEGRTIYKKFNPVANNVYVKIPVNPCLDEKCDLNSDGIKAIKTLSSEGIPVNCTLIFTPEQAFLAAKAGAKIVSPFVGREDDFIREINRIDFNKQDYFPKEGFKKNRKILHDEGIVSGIDLVEKCVEVLRKSKLKTEVIAASIRNKRQFRDAMEVGADIATLPIEVIEDLLKHQQTRKGMEGFSKDSVQEYKNILRKK